MNTLLTQVMPALKVLETFKSKSNFTNMNNVSEKVKKEVAFSLFVTVILVIFLQIMPVMLIAVNCNPKSPVLYGIIAFLFPGIYLFQHTFRKYLLKEKGYCGNK